MFDLNNIDTITEAGYHYAAIKMGEKEAWEIVEKCHKHYRRREKVQQKIQRIRQRMIVRQDAKQ